MCLILVLEEGLAFEVINTFEKVTGNHIPKQIIKKKR